VYDVENRMIGNGLQKYVYDPAGKRVKKWNGTASWEYYFYGIGGQKLVTLSCSADNGCGVPQYNVYFGGKLVMSKGAVVVTDRLGSVRASGGERMSYYPYGEEKTSTGDGREKFGTYTRDNVGQDYADQRYYAVGMGRFNTADPYRASAGPRDPSSWNRFSYVQGDPVNFTDPRGLEVYNPSYCPPEDENCEGPDGQPGDAAGGGGSWGPCDPLWGQQFAEVPDAACYAPPEPPPPPAKPKRKPPCNPGFLDPNTTYTGADGYSFTGKDIDYAARASNNAAEQTAGADVIYNRVDDPAFRTNGHMEETLTAVVRAPHQFNAVTSPGPNRKFRQSGPDRYKYLNPADCAGLRSAVQSMLSVVTNGATADYDFFAAANATTQGTLIGQTRFW
jgi:RHS repeat-associated protein